MRDKKHFTWSWRKAVSKSNMEACTKLLLHTLANYMDAGGNGAFPSVATLAKDMSTTKRTVFKHLKLAEAAGFIIKTRRITEAGAHDTSLYTATWPKNIPQVSTLDQTPSEGSEPDSPPSAPSAPGLVHDVHPTNTNITKKRRTLKGSPKSPSSSDLFEKFWAAYPQRKKAKSKCLQKWRSRKLHERFTEIMAGLKNLKDNCKDWHEGYAPMPLTFLNQERWNDEPNQPAPKERSVW